MKPPAEVDGFVRTVIETVDPALQPVAKLRRFVVKRVQVVGAPLRDRARPSTTPGTSRAAPPRRRARPDVRE